MKRPGLVVVVLSAALLSSCSWAKLRYQKVRTYFHRQPSAARTASLVSIQPTAAQEAAARRLIASMRSQAETTASAPPPATAGYRENTSTSAAAYPPPAPTAPPRQHLPRPQQLPDSSVAAPQRAAAFSAPHLNIPDETPAHALPSPAAPHAYTGSSFVPRSAPDPFEEQGDSTGTTPQEPTSAIMRGMRSPSLPTGLPMDINGKLNTTSTP